MEDAIIVLSRKGQFKSTINARQILSHEHARKLWPIVAPDSLLLVTWVRASFKDDKLQRRSHFRLLAGQKSYDPKEHFAQEETERRRSVGESSEHASAKALIAAELSFRLNNRQSMPWTFKDPSVSDFPFRGDLLLGADEVAIEKDVETPFGCSFRLDIAVLGTSVTGQSMILGGIEIERTHAFDGRKTLLGKAVGFPLISIDISGMDKSDITHTWARNALSQTTQNNSQRRRWTYVYLHDLLYPLFSQFPDSIDINRRHQYIVFSDDRTLEKLLKWINQLGKFLHYEKGELATAMVNAKSEHSRKMLLTAGGIVGEGWRAINERCCLRVTAPRPKSSTDLRAFRLHLSLTRLFLCHANALVGYQYCNRISNQEPENDIWVHELWCKELREYKYYRVLPKRLAEPMSHILSVINSLKPREIEVDSSLG